MEEKTYCSRCLISRHPARIHVGIKRESHHTMKSQCLFRQNKYHTTAWIESEAAKLGWFVEIPELGGLWEIVEIYQYQLTDRQLRTDKALVITKTLSIDRKSTCNNLVRFPEIYSNSSSRRLKN
jgi:hypothetical protein